MHESHQQTTITEKKTTNVKDKQKQANVSSKLYRPSCYFERIRLINDNQHSSGNRVRVRPSNNLTAAFENYEAVTIYPKHQTS